MTGSDTTRHAGILAAVAIALLTAGAAQTPSDPKRIQPASRAPDDGIRKLAVGLLGGLERDPAGGKRRLTVSPLVTGAGDQTRVTRLGVEVARRLERELVTDAGTRGKVRVYASSRVRQMLTAAGVSRFVSAGVARRTAKSLGAELMVWGTVSLKENGYHVIVELRRIEDDELLSAGDLVLPRNPDRDGWFDQTIRATEPSLSALLDTAGWVLSRRIAEQVKPKGGSLRVAVLDLEGPMPKQLGPIGRGLARRIENDLFETAGGKMTLFERSLFATILKGRNIEMYGPGFERQVGEFLTTKAVKAFVVGRVMVEGVGDRAAYAVSVRLVDSATTQILASARTSFARPTTRVEPRRSGPYWKGIGSLVAGLLANMAPRPADGSKRIAVGAFACDKTRYTGGMGDMLSADIHAALAETHRLPVVDRGELRVLLEQGNLYSAAILEGREAGLKRPQSHPDFALAVRGSYTANPRDEVLTVRAEIVDAHSGERLGTASVRLPYDALPPGLDAGKLTVARQLTRSLSLAAGAVDKQIGVAPAAGGVEPLRVRVWTEGRWRTFKAGQLIVFKVTVNRDAYVRLFNVRPDGTAVMLFPNAYHSDNVLSAGKVLTVPSGKMDFEFFAEPPFGPEAVQVVATSSVAVSRYVGSRGLDGSEDRADPFKALPRGAAGLAEVILDARARGIGTRAKPEPDEAPRYAEDHWVFQTESAK